MDSYWTWLQANLEEVRSRVSAEPLAWKKNMTLVPLRDRADADYEASWMEHSVGYSWDSYSSFGDIYGLRNGDGFPIATLLVVDEVVVHARERCNARLGPDTQEAMEEFSAAMGWDIKPDVLPFELWGVPMTPAIDIAYMARRDGRPASFGSMVLHNDLAEDGPVRLAQVLGGAVFLPDDAGLPSLTGFEGQPHEIISVEGTHEDPTVATTFGEMLKALTRSNLPRP